MDPLVIVLRFVHVVFGALWVGMVAFVTFFLMPALQAAGPEGGKVMAAVNRRGFMTALPILAIGALISGFWLYYIVGAGDPAAFGRSPRGMTLGAGRSRRADRVGGRNGGGAPIDAEGDAAGRAEGSGGNSATARPWVQGQQGAGASAALRAGRDGRRPLPLGLRLRPWAAAALLAACSTPPSAAPAPAGAARRGRIALSRPARSARPDRRRGLRRPHDHLGWHAGRVAVRQARLAAPSGARPARYGRLRIARR